MARVRLVQKDQASPTVAELFQKMEANGAMVLNLYRALGNSPAVIASFMKLGSQLLNQAELSPKLRELAILRVAKLSGSEYEWVQHVPIALEVGITKRQIDDVAQWKQAAGFTELERAVLQYVDEVAVNVVVKDSTFEELRGHLNEREIVELTISIGYWGMVARVLVPLQVEIDDHPVGSTGDLFGKSKKS